MTDPRSLWRTCDDRPSLTMTYLWWQTLAHYDIPVMTDPRSLWHTCDDRPSLTMTYLWWQTLAHYDIPVMTDPRSLWHTCDDRPSLTMTYLWWQTLAHYDIPVMTDPRSLWRTCHVITHFFIVTHFWCHGILRWHILSYLEMVNNRLTFLSPDPDDLRGGPSHGILLLA